MKTALLRLVLVSPLRDFQSLLEVGDSGWLHGSKSSGTHAPFLMHSSANYSMAQSDCLSTIRVL